MANYADSVLLAAVGKLNKPYQDKEFRRKLYGAHNMFLDGVEYTIPDLAAIREAETQTTTTKYLTKSTPTVGSARSCSPSPTVGDSGTADLSWTTYSFPITVSYKRHSGNFYKRAEALAAELEGGFQAAHDAIETAMVAYLESNKTGVNAGSAFMGTFDTTNDIFPITQANKDRFYNYIMTVMRENKYSGRLLAAENVGAGAIHMEQTAQGQANSSNLGYQYGNIEFMPSHSITVTSDYNIKSYVAAPDSVAVLDWIPPLNRQGEVAGEREWTTMADPFGFPWTWSVLYKKTCADTSGSGGATQDLTEVWEISIDLALTKAPLSVADETPIFKFGLQSS